MHSIYFNLSTNSVVFWSFRDFNRNESCLSYILLITKRGHVDSFLFCENQNLIIITPIDFIVIKICLLLAKPSSFKIFGCSPLLWGTFCCPTQSFATIGRSNANTLAIFGASALHLLAILTVWSKVQSESHLTPESAVHFWQVTESTCWRRGWWWRGSILSSIPWTCSSGASLSKVVVLQIAQFWNDPLCFFYLRISLFHKCPSWSGHNHFLPSLCPRSFSPANNPDQLSNQFHIQQPKQNGPCHSCCFE